MSIMTAINSSEFNTTVNQLQGVFKQLGSSAMGEYGTYVNSVFAIGGSIEQIAKKFNVKPDQIRIKK